jgi:hypothetical protein
MGAKYSMRWWSKHGNKIFPGVKAAPLRGAVPKPRMKNIHATHVKKLVASRWNGAIFPTVVQHSFF